MDLVVLEEDQPLVPVIKEEAISSDHNEEKPILEPQNIKEEINYLNISMVGEEKDPLKISNEETNNADTNKCYAKEEKYKVIEEDSALQSFKTETSNLENENIMHSSYAQDIKFTINMKEQNIKHLVNESSVSGVIGCVAVSTDDSIGQIKPTDPTRSLRNHSETENSQNDVYEKIFHNKQMSVKNERKKYKCFECGKMLFSLKNMNYHVNCVHKNFRQFKCYYCGNCFPQKVQLVGHMASIHEGIKSNHCSECDKAFFRISDLKRHINIVHKGIKDHNCDKCEKRFSTVSNLNIHVKAVHMCIKDYNCGECGMKFSTLCVLKRHVNVVHNKNIKDYNCSECGKRFSTVSHLKTHINVVHKGIKNYNCGDCGNKFSAMFQLHRHINVIHKGIKNYTCGECQKRFSRVYHLKTHINVVHKSV